MNLRFSHLQVMMQYTAYVSQVSISDAVVPSGEFHTLQSSWTYHIYQNASGYFKWNSVVLWYISGNNPRHNYVMVIIPAHLVLLHRILFDFCASPSKKVFRACEVMSSVKTMQLQSESSRFLLFPYFRGKLYLIFEIFLWSSLHTGPIIWCKWNSLWTQVWSWSECVHIFVAIFKVTHNWDSELLHFLWLTNFKEKCRQDLHSTVNRDIRCTLV